MSGKLFVYISAKLFSVRKMMSWFESHELLFKDHDVETAKKIHEYWVFNTRNKDTD